MDILIGMIGAIIGGSLMNLVGQAGVTGSNRQSLVVVVVGAVVVIYVGRMMRYG